MANKLIDWLIAQVSLEDASSTIIVSCVYVYMYMCVHCTVYHNVKQ